LVAAVGSAMVTGRMPGVPSDCMHCHDYVYVDDAIDAFVRAGYAPTETTGTYNIGSGRQTSAAEVCDLISVMFGEGAWPALSQSFSDDSPAIALDSTKAEEQLGWRATVGLPDGIRRTIQWLRSAMSSSGSTRKEGAPCPI
jgi:UDP-glucose 4-epimerase